jgi:hypothetical protein
LDEEDCGSRFPLEVDLVVASTFGSRSPLELGLPVWYPKKKEKKAINSWIFTFF